MLPVGISFYTFQALSYVIDVYSAAHAGPDEPARRRRVHRVLPQPARRAHHARHDAAAADRARAAVLGVGRARRHPAPRLGLLQEARHRRQRRRHREQGVRAAVARVLRALGRRVRVLHPDLRRLLRLRGHRARRGEMAGHRSRQELRAPVSREGPDRVLAALEHLPLDVVPRLRLPARGLPHLGPADLGSARLLLDAATWAYAGGMILTMLTAGLWHGASWNFVIWGAYHGVLLAARENRRLPCGDARRRVRRWLAPLQVAGMFMLTNLGWLFFRRDRARATRPAPQPVALPGDRARAPEPAHTCSSSRRCTRSRCGSRASGRSSAGGTSWPR
ncbi:MAG: hypothetical protein M0C28_16325 [Candidatus Moduliflexus flocculans]|nr:hypothetical protein [Candidatus Moduliflexus flocculans]